MYEVNYSPYVSNYFHCRIRPEGLLCDAECDLLAIAKFLVTNGVVTSMVRLRHELVIYESRTNVLRFPYTMTPVFV